jgi:hypothetical protein
MQTVTASILTAAALLVERPPPGPAPTDFDLKLGHQATRPTPVRAGHPVRSGHATPGPEVATPATSASDTHSQSPPVTASYRQPSAAGGTFEHHEKPSLPGSRSPVSHCSKLGPGRIAGQPGGSVGPAGIGQAGRFVRLQRLHRGKRQRLLRRTTAVINTSAGRPRYRGAPTRPPSAVAPLPLESFCGSS